MQVGIGDRRVKVSFLVGLFVLSAFSCTIFANTLFVADRGASHVDIFHMDPNMTPRHIGMIDYPSINHVPYGLGPIDFAMDEAQQIVFVSFETVGINDVIYPPRPEKLCTCKIALIDFNTLTHIKDIEFPGADYFGGLYYDSPRQRLYAVERDTNLLYVLKWHPETLMLDCEKVVQLANIQYACAIQVDGDMAYITEYLDYPYSSYYTHIMQYDISRDWAYVQTIPNGQATVCLAYDSQRKIFYSGAYGDSGGLW
jgi:hypothetical protein